MKPEHNCQTILVKGVGWPGIPKIEVVKKPVIVKVKKPVEIKEPAHYKEREFEKLAFYMLGKNGLTSHEISMATGKKPKSTQLDLRKAFHAGIVLREQVKNVESPYFLYSGVL